MAKKSGWRRDQKYKHRTRHLYALLFSDGVYIGQTVDLVQREAQHRSPRGDWGGKQFRCQPLGTIVGTEADAVEYEHAWRLEAQRQGYRVFAKPPGIPCNPSRKATWKRRRIARTLAWPGTRRSGRRRSWLGWLALTVGSVVLARWLIG